MEQLNQVEQAIAHLFRAHYQQHGRLPILTYQQILDSKIAQTADIRSALQRLCEQRLIYCAGSVQWTSDSLFFLIGEAAMWARLDPRRS